MSVTAITRGGILSARRPPAIKAKTDGGVKSAATTSTTVGIPGTTAVGDLLLLAVAVVGTADTISTPTGWTKQAGPVDSTAGSANIRGYLFSRVADGTEGASFTVAKVGTATGWRPLLLVSNAQAGVDVVASAAASAAGLTVTFASVTPTVLYDTILAVVFPRSTVTDTTPPTGFIEYYDSASGTPSVEVSRRAPATTGATGTFTAAINSSVTWVAFTVAVKHI